MIKILGCVLILSASICACIFYERAEKAKLCALKELCDFIKHIRSQIEYFSAPLDKIYASYEKRGEIISLLVSDGVESIKELLNKADFEIAYSFFSSLGKGVKSEQIALCSYTIGELDSSYEEKKAELPNKIKVFRAMALFCGFCAVILLI